MERFLPCLYAFLGCGAFCFIFELRRWWYILSAAATGAAAATAAEAAEMPAERLPLNKSIGNASLKRSGRIPLRTFYTGVQTWENLTAYCLPVILTIPS